MKNRFEKHYRTIFRELSEFGQWNAIEYQRTHPNDLFLNKHHNEDQDDTELSNSEEDKNNKFRSAGTARRVARMEFLIVRVVSVV